MSISSLTRNIDLSRIGFFANPQRGRGRREAVGIREGFSLVRTDVVFDEPFNGELECPDSFLRLHFKLHGESAIADEESDFERVEAGRISMVVMPAQRIKRERVSIDTLERSITLICDRDFTASMISPNAELPAMMTDFLRGGLSRLRYESMPMPVQLRPIVETILDPPLSGKLGEVMVEAKALELMCFTVNQILNMPNTGRLIRERDRRRVRQLCDLIESDPTSMLSIAQLSRSVGWNETQMTECFKAVTGMTISNYGHRLRMDRARRQLETTDMPVTEIAFNAGYEHPTNFATAFKRTFGFPPRIVRDQRLMGVTPAD